MRLSPLLMILPALVLLAGSGSAADSLGRKPLPGDFQRIERPEIPTLPQRREGLEIPDRRIDRFGADRGSPSLGETRDDARGRPDDRLDRDFGTRRRDD